MASAGTRENTKQYLERLIANGFKIRSRGYTSNGIVKRTTVVGQGDVYSCGERINRLAARGLLKADIGVLANHQVTSGTGQYDNITMVFEELLTKNREGFSVFTNMRSTAASIPLKFNTVEETSAGTKLNAKLSYKYHWDHQIYTSKDDPKTITNAEATSWITTAGWDSANQRYTSLGYGLNSTDFDANTIEVVQNGNRPTISNPVLVKFSDTGTYGDTGDTLSSKLPNTKSFTTPDIAVVQTIYTENPLILSYILESNNRLFAPRQTNREYYDTFGIKVPGSDSVFDDTNNKWRVTVNSIDTQSAISKAVVTFQYRPYGWDTDVYQAYASAWDAFTNKTTTAGQPPEYS